MAAKPIPRLQGPPSAPGRGPGQPSGRMFPPPGPRSTFPGQPGPWWDGPWPCPPQRPEPPWDEPAWDEPAWDEPAWDEPAWDEPPWDEPPRDEPPREQQRRSRRRRRRRPPSPRAPRPFPGPGDIPWKEEQDRWPPQDCPLPPQDCPLPPPWDDREAIPGPENAFGDGWHQPNPRDLRPFPGPGDIPWEEEHGWAPHACPPRPPWDDREDFQGHEDGFGDGWHQELLPEPWPEFPQEEQPPPWHPSGPPRIPGAFRGLRPPGRRSLRRSHLRQLTQVPLARCPRPPRGHKPYSKPSSALSKRIQPMGRKELQPPEPPQPPAALQGAAESSEPPQDVPVSTGNVLEPPNPAGSPQESPAAAEPPVELGAEQIPVGSQDQDPCALGTNPAPPEETSRYPEIQEHLEVEPCSPGVPKAGTSHGSHPQSPAAPPEPAKRDLLESSSSGEAGAEPSPHSWEQPLRGAEEAEGEAAQDGPLQSLQPPKNPPGPAAEPEAQPSQASPGACSTAETSPRPQHPPGAGETKLAVPGQPQLCSLFPTPFPAGMDLRSAIVLAKKAQIELSYQQFSLTIAVVATMLLQKEPSMEAALGLALRANLRQRRLHHLQELREFIDAIDSASL